MVLTSPDGRVSCVLCSCCAVHGSGTPTLLSKLPVSCAVLLSHGAAKRGRNAAALRALRLVKIRSRMTVEFRDLLQDHLCFLFTWLPIPEWEWRHLFPAVDKFAISTIHFCHQSRLSNAPRVLYLRRSAGSVVRICRKSCVCHKHTHAPIEVFRPEKRQPMRPNQSNQSRVCERVFRNLQRLVFVRIKPMFAAKHYFFSVSP